MMWREYFRNRFYIRGSSALGLFNTVLGCLCNRVVIWHIDDTGHVVRWSIGKASDFPPMR